MVARYKMELTALEREAEKLKEDIELKHESEENDLKKVLEEHKKSKNPWEKIIEHCEMNKSKYSGSQDVTRLRQAMLA